MRGDQETLTIKGLHVSFYCAGCGAEDEGSHVRAAARMLADEIFRPTNRLDDPWSRSRLLGEFRERLDLAREGRLIPREECRPVGDGTFPLYEIRWQEVVVKEALPSSPRGHQSRTLLARLIHAEPDLPPYSMVTLHPHQKIITGDKRETRDLQDEEIRIAGAKYDDGRASTWGVVVRHEV